MPSNGKVNMNAKVIFNSGGTRKTTAKRVGEFELYVKSKNPKVLCVPPLNNKKSEPPGSPE